MKFEVSRVDFEVLLTIYELLQRGGGNFTLTRNLICQHSGVTPQALSKRVNNNYLKEQQLKEKIQ